MKATKLIFLLASLALGFSTLAAEPSTNAPAKIEPATNAVSAEMPAPALLTSGQGGANSATAASTNGAGTNLLADKIVRAPSDGAGTNLVSAEAVSTNVSLAPAIYNPTEGLRLNFRNVPLEMVLNYLSEAAGFIIVLETQVSGKVDVWSNQPLTKDEAIRLLNSVLNKNGYAAIRNERTLTIVARDAAKTRDIPVKRGHKPEEIQKSDEMITQILPVQYINAAQLMKDLQPLLPTASQMSANEAGNALVITDSQTNIRRMAEIVAALDMPADSRVSIRVTMLRFADAKTVATVIKDLFQSQDQRQNMNDPRAQFFRMRFGGGGGGGGGGFGGPGGPGGEAGAGGQGNPRAPTPKVTATSDDRSNAVIVSAPEDVMPSIDDLLKEIDQEVEDVTEVRVFRLKYADPMEMAELLAGLFPDDTRNDSQNNRGQVRFGGGGGGGGGFAGRFGRAQTANAQGQPSDRMKKMGRVIAVPDQRTASVVVSAARELMVQIGAMIEQLDSNPAKKQKVYVYSLENADVQEVEQLLRDMFDRTGTANTRNNANQRNALNSRSTANSQNQGNNRNTGMGTTGTGNRGTGGANY